MSSGHTLNLVLDQGVPRDAAALLRDAGVNCTHVGEVEMSNATDSAILNWAFETGAVIITLDADFHMLLAVSGAKGPSVVRVRREGLRAPALAQLVHEVLATFVEDLTAGAVVTVKARKSTCHRLPIGRRSIT